MLLSELEYHLQTLEDSANRAGSLTDEDQTRLAPALYSIILLLRDERFKDIVLRHQTDVAREERIMWLAARCYAVLALAYVHKTTGHLADLSEEAMGEAGRTLLEWFSLEK